MSVYLIIWDSLDTFSYLRGLQRQFCFYAAVVVVNVHLGIARIPGKSHICSHLLLTSVGREGASPLQYRAWGDIMLALLRRQES